MSVRLTKKRNKILEVLKNHQGTLSAADIHKKLEGIDLVTIYRSLDLFVKENLIKKVHLRTEEVQYEYQAKPHHHAVCTACEKVLHFTAPDQKIKKLLGLNNFEINEIEMTVRGICHHEK